MLLEEKIKQFLIKKYGEKNIYHNTNKTIKKGFLYTVEILANYNVMETQSFNEIYKELGKKYNKRHESIRGAILVYSQNLTSLSSDGFLMYNYMELLKKGIIKN